MEDHNTGLDIALIGIDQDVLYEISLSLKGDNCTSNLFPNINDFLTSQQAVHTRCLIIDLEPSQIKSIPTILGTLASDQHRWPTVLVSKKGRLPEYLNSLRLISSDVLSKFHNSEIIEAVEYSAGFRNFLKDKNRLLLSVSLPKGIKKLTNREMEVLGQLLCGHPSKVIASNMQISVKTVEIHRSRILQKMHSRSTTELLGEFLQAR